MIIESKDDFRDPVFHGGLVCVSTSVDTAPFATDRVCMFWDLLSLIQILVQFQPWD